MNELVKNYDLKEMISSRIFKTNKTDNIFLIEDSSEFIKIVTNNSNPSKVQKYMFSLDNNKFEIYSASDPMVNSKIEFDELDDALDLWNYLFNNV